jgi:hypothetical protein
MVKKRERIQPTEEQIDAFAGQAEGEPKKQARTRKKEAEGVARTTISLPKGLMNKIEQKAFKNKQNGIEPKSVSALIRDALETYLK